MAAFPASASSVVPTDQLVLRAAVSAFLGRYRGQTRVHTDSDLRVFLRWCNDQVLDPLAAARVDIERYVRWLQDVRRYQASTVSRRLSLVVGFCRVCVIDAILEHSPADYVRRPTVPAESPTLGLGHLQFEALITTARLSSNPNDFALVALLGLLGLRIFEACGSLAPLPRTVHREQAGDRDSDPKRLRCARGGSRHRAGGRVPIPARRQTEPGAFSRQRCRHVRRLVATPQGMGTGRPRSDQAPAHQLLRHRCVHGDREGDTSANGALDSRRADGAPA
ncbi:site-specific integrase [Micromonospora sp. U56]|nr:site-specific integrase [Micromonospora sp. U56]